VTLRSISVSQGLVMWLLLATSVEGQCLQVASRLPTFPSFVERHKEVFQEYTYDIKSEEFINFENPVTNCSYEITVWVRKFTFNEYFTCNTAWVFSYFTFPWIFIVDSFSWLYNLPVLIMYAVYFWEFEGRRRPANWFLTSQRSCLFPGRDQIYVMLT
jgi:hypothetical protein